MFTLTKRDVGDVTPFEYLPASGGLTLTPGMTLKVSAGVLALAAGGVRPDYICVGPARNDGLAPVYRVHPDMEFTTTAAAAVAAADAGKSYTIDSAGQGITATTSGGVFTVTWADGGTTVCGRFC